MHYSNTEDPHPFLSTNLPITWSRLSPDAALVDIPLAIKRAQDSIDAIAATPLKEAHYLNSFHLLDITQECLSRSWARLEHLKAVADSPEIRKTYGTLLPQITAFSSALFLNKALYTVLKAVFEQRKDQELSPIQIRFMEETLKDFLENGAELSLEKQEQLKTIHEELAKLTQAFTENVLDATHAWELVIKDETQLAGLPSSAIAEAKQSAEQKGLLAHGAPAWRFTLQGPSQTAVLTYLDDVSIRKSLWEAAQSIGRNTAHNNWPLIQNILKLRAKLAEILGKAHFPDYVLSRRMAKTGQSALNFVEELHKRIQKAFQNECETLASFRAESLGLSKVEPFEPWDYAYWAEKLRKARYDFDEEALRPYFPEDKVIQGLFKLSNHVFGVQISEVRTTELPHSFKQNQSQAVDSIRYYQLTDQASQRILGYFYTDWQPRENKREGAWMSVLATGEPFSQEHYEPHIGTINGNFSPALGNQPSLLTHTEVETLFHEFGHLLHHLLSQVPIRSLSGTRVAWDFVEFPSQLMENWCWERKSLDLFARHFETAEPIPEDLFQKMIKARSFMAASRRMRQLMLSKMDLELHLKAKDYSQLTAKEIETSLQTSLKDYTQIFKTTPPVIAPRFSHLFGGGAIGYAAGYYSYQWAEVLEADAFSRFLESPESLLSPLIGKELRQKVLSKGNSTDPDLLFQDLMGRAPNSDALLKRDQLLT